MKRILFLTLALMVVFSSMAFATLTRVETMGMVNNIVIDDLVQIVKSNHFYSEKLILMRDKIMGRIVFLLPCLFSKQSSLLISPSTFS